MRIPREGGLQKSLHTLTSGRAGQIHFYVIFSKPIFYIINRASSGLARIILHLRLEGKKRIRMSCFSVTDPFLTTFYYVEKRNGALRKNRGRGLKNLTYPYMGAGGGVKNCKNHPCVINEWPLTIHISCIKYMSIKEFSEYSKIL